MEEQIGIVAVHIDRIGSLCIGREVRLVRIENPPCGHDECKEQVMFSRPRAFGLSRDATAIRLMRKLGRERYAEWKSDRAREASEALGG